MSKEYFERSEFEARRVKVRQAMAAKNIDLLLVTSPININYLIGAAAKSYQVFQCVLFPLEDLPLVYLLRRSDVAEVSDLSLADEVQGWGGLRPENPIDRLAEILRAKGWLSKRIGLETPAYYVSVSNYLKLRDVLSDTVVSDCTDMVENLKLAKSTAELAYVKKAAEIADVGIDAIRESLAIGKTERQVAADAHRAMMAAGGESPASPMNFVSGERTCYGHGFPLDRVLRRGDFMHVEFGGQYRRYCSTIARHFCMEAPSARAQEIHDATMEACDAAISVIKAGVPAHQPHQAARDIMMKRGLIDYFVHTTGYGIAPGFPPSWGESINMLDDDGAVLEAGMVVSVEPPVFIHAERIGARLIDCVIVEKNGASVLSRHPRDLMVIK